MTGIMQTVGIAIVVSIVTNIIMIAGTVYVLKDKVTSQVQEMMSPENMMGQMMGGMEDE